MATFTLKARDTRPVLKVTLFNPNGTPFDFTDTTAWNLHVRISSTNLFARPMTKVGPNADGTLQYVWQASDWGNGAGLLPIVPSGSVKEFRMEYEVLGASEPFTFPNGENDTLKIVGDLG